MNAPRRIESVGSPAPSPALTLRKLITDAFMSCITYVFESFQTYVTRFPHSAAM